jgi:hypothetical protein
MLGQKVSDKKPLSVWKIARWGVLLILVIIVIQILRKPKPLAPPPDPQTRAQLAQQFQQKLGDLESAKERGETGAEVQFTSEEVSAAFVGDPATQAQAMKKAAPALPGNQPLPKAENAQVSFASDRVTGQFTTNVYGKDVVVTLSAHLRAEGGYLQIEPTDFKVGELAVPIGLVDSVVRKKLSEPETREKLKLPDWVADVRVENGQLVVKEK